MYPAYSILLLLTILYSYFAAHILLANKEEAARALQALKGKFFKGCPLMASYSQSDFILFIGNIPFTYNTVQMKNMLKPFGELERAILVRSELTGQSKGYGIVEFTYKTAAEKAKSGLQSTHKHLRVDVANSGLNEYRDLQSQTLYVNQFPNDTTSEQIEEIINKHVQVPFCKVGLLLNHIF